MSPGGTAPPALASGDSNAPDDTLDPRTSIRLKDPSLLSQHCYVDGRWTDAQAGTTMNVVNPANGRGSAPPRGWALPKRGSPSTPPLPPFRLAREDGQGTKRSPAQVVRSDARQQRRPGADSHHRAREAAGGVERRDRDRRGVHRVVRRRSEARLRRRDTDDLQRPPARRREGAGRRVRRDHAVEFPVVDDHPQGRARACRGLHRRDQARRGHALLGAGACRARASGGISAGRAQRRHRRRARDRRRDVRESHGAQALVHGLDRGRPAS